MFGTKSKERNCCKPNITQSFYFSIFFNFRQYFHIFIYLFRTLFHISVPCSYYFVWREILKKKFEQTFWNKQFWKLNSFSVRGVCAWCVCVCACVRVCVCACVCACVCVIWGDIRVDICGVCCMFVLCIVCSGCFCVFMLCVVCNRVLVYVVGVYVCVCVSCVDMVWLLYVFLAGYVMTRPHISTRISPQITHISPTYITNIKCVCTCAFRTTCH